MPIRLQVLGGLHAFRDDVPLAWVPAQHISSALLVYLALEREATREQLARVFWPDEEVESARHALRQALYRLRHAAGDGLVEDTGDVLRFSVPVACDALDFERAVEGGDFAAATAFYGGAFLKDVSLSASREFEAWTDRQRARFGRLHRRACRARIETLVGNGAIPQAIEAARAWATLEPFDDEAQHRLIELLAGSGQRADALAQYEHYARLLQGEELEPLDETKALVAMLRAGEVGSDAIVPASLAHPGLTAQAPAPSPPSGGVTATATQPVRARLGRLGTRWPLAAAVLLVAVMALAFGRWLLPRAETPRYARTAIAVLPFENLSGEGPNAYVAGALHDVMLTQLAKLGALSVRGRTSVMGYAGTSKPIPVIADELSVGTIVQGSVQVAGMRLRVNVRLIDAAKDEHLWAEQYDRTLDDFFAVESDITQQIVAAVGATLGAAERTALAAAPTANPEAYRLYLRGEEYRRNPVPPANRVVAQSLYEDALALDSTFALAWAALSWVHAMEWSQQVDPAARVPERRLLMREAAEKALRLAPDLPQAHIAMGWAHFWEFDWRAALREYRIALEGLPNDADLWARIGYASRRIGEWDEALAAFNRVVALDPRNAWALWDLGAGTYRQLHRYQEALEWYNRALELAPEAGNADYRRAQNWVLWRGRLDSLASYIARDLPDSSSHYYGCLTALRLLWERKPDSIFALLRGSRAPLPIFICNDIYLPYTLYSAWAHRLKGNEAAARLAFDSARAMLDTLVLRPPPKDWRTHAARGMAYAGLGRPREALLEARWLEGTPISMSRDTYWGPILAEDRARILAGIGEADAALDELERLLAGPSLTSVHTLRLDPRFDPIRSHPRFQALLLRYAEPKPVR